MIFGCVDNDAEAMEDHDRKLKSFFERCRQVNLKPNKDGLTLRKTQVSHTEYAMSYRQEICAGASINGKLCAKISTKVVRDIRASKTADKERDRILLECRT